MATLTGKWKAAIGIFFLVALLSMGGLRHYYTWHRPESADTSSRRTIAIAVSYSRRVYVTPAEQKLLYGTYVVLALAGIGVVVAYFVERKW